MSAISKMRELSTRPVDIAWLAGLRIAFGLTMLVSALRFLAYGWIDDFWVKPDFHFKYWGFAWVEPLPASGMHALFVFLAVAAFTFTLGLFFRLSAIVLFLGLTYVQLLDVATYLNHYYLASLVLGLFALSPANRAFSLDAMLRGRHAREVPFAWLALFRSQVAIVYTFAGLAKANSDWLLHAQPIRIWIASKADMPILGALFSLPHAALAMSWAGFLFDTTIVWFLLHRRTRPFAYVAVVVFHVLTRILFPIGMFPIIMMVGALVFFPPETWRRALERAAALFPRRFFASSREAKLGAGSPWVSVAMALFILVQCVLPLRFLAYGGNVRWHEQGMRFSWRVMVREKNGSVTFVVRERDTGRTYHVAPRSYLTSIQEREMSSQPDLILQLAHHVASDVRNRSGHDVSVNAIAIASLNGRRVAPLVDPDVDLTRVDDGLAKALWILPEPAGDPPHLRSAPAHDARSAAL